MRHRRGALFCLLFFFHEASAHATTFHVATTGNDSAAGSQMSPWRTIQRCADVAQAGDVCRVHTGTYRETVTPRHSGTAAAPLRFEAAAGECATVSGADVLTGEWSRHSGAIWATPTSKQFIQLFSGGKLLNEARWPNADPADLVHMPMAKAGPGTDANGIVATGAPPGDWTGALVLVLPGTQWWSYTRHVTAFDPVSQRLTVDQPISDPSLVPKADSRYYLFGSLRALDSEGEWFLDRGTEKLFLWPPEGADPGTLQLEAKARTWTFDVTNQSYVEIAGFRTFAGSIRLNNANHCTVDGIRGEYVSAMRETNGWTLTPDVPTIWGDFNVWKNSVLAHSAASGLWISGNDNLVVNNIIHDVDTVALQRAGIEYATWLSSSRNVIAHNTIFRAGWAGIGMTGASSCRTLFNRITDASLLVRDAGSLYAATTDGQGSEIAWNEMAGAPCEYCTGVYLDDDAKNFVVHHNYLHDLGWHGISFKNTNAVFNNTIGAVGRSAFSMSRNANGTWDAVSSAIVLNNVIDDSTGISFSLHSASQTDFDDFLAPVLATRAWQHFSLPFSALFQSSWAKVVPLDLRVAQWMQFRVESLGAFSAEVDNVRLEGPLPRLLSDFESGLGTAFGSAWWGSSANGSINAPLLRQGPGVVCSSGAAMHSGTQAVSGWNAIGVPLSGTADGTQDLSAYTGISFDLRARSQLWISPDFQGSSPLAPFQGLNYPCPVDANQVPLTDCAIGKAQQITGYVAAGADLGAFQSGEPRWKAGAQFAEDPASCSRPADVVLNLPPAAPYPTTPAGSWPAPELDPEWHEPTCTANSTILFVPVVLSLAGLNSSFYTSELTLTNRAPAGISVGYQYTAFAGGGSGASVSEDVLGAGRQLVIPDVISHLRELGLPIPVKGSFGGTLRLTIRGVSSPGDVAAVVRTTTPVPPLSPIGRAGLAYAAVPQSALLSAPVLICGLRQTPTDRSAVAFQNAGGVGDGDVTLRASFFAGDGSSSSPVATTETTLLPGGFAQPALPDLGDWGSSFYVRVERVSGTAGFYAYGVVNDNGTNDGSFVTPLPLSAVTSLRGLLLPVVVDAPPFSTEVILTNTTADTKELRLVLASGALSGGSTSVSLRVMPGEQLIIPAFVHFLRERGAPGMVSATGPIVGPVFATGNTSGVVASARTWNPDSSGAGRYGLFYSAVPFGEAADDSAWLFGLQQSGESRSNLALVNTGEVDGGRDTFRVELFSGETGAKLGEVTQDVDARGFVQLGRVLTLVPGNAPNGFARITRTAGKNPFIAYAVVNDGAGPGERSGDGAFVKMVRD